MERLQLRSRLQTFETAIGVRMDFLEDEVKDLRSAVHVAMQGQWQQHEPLHDHKDTGDVSTEATADIPVQETDPVTQDEIEEAKADMDNWGHWEFTDTYEIWQDENDKMHFDCRIGECQKSYQQKNTLDNHRVSTHKEEKTEKMPHGIMPAEELKRKKNMPPELLVWNFRLRKERFELRKNFRDTFLQDKGYMPREEAVGNEVRGHIDKWLQKNPCPRLKKRRLDNHSDAPLKAGKCVKVPRPKEHPKSIRDEYEKSPSTPPVSPERELATPPPFPRQEAKVKPLLILEPNGILVARRDNGEADFIVKGEKWVRRCFLSTFLDFAFREFHVAVWSSSAEEHMQASLPHVFGGRESDLVFVWSRDNCSTTKFLKDIRGVFQMTGDGAPGPWNTFLVDDHATNMLLNQEYCQNCLILPAFEPDDAADNWLLKLRDWLTICTASGVNFDSYATENPFGVMSPRKNKL